MTRLISIIFFFFCLQIGVLCQASPKPGPVQLLDFAPNDNKTVTITKGSIEKLFLDPLVSDRDVVVVSIAGAFRKGKSFLLNYMLRYMYANYKSVAQPDKIINETNSSEWIGSPDEPLEGFSWKSSTKRETTGIIFWSDVFLYDAPSGEKIAIYLMDTQGLFDHFSSPTDNIRIFSLSALISSVQLMNLFTVIEENQLEYLQFATEIARFNAVEASSESKPFQKLMFIIRDWISAEEYEYGLKGGNKFIESFLTIRDFHTAELKEVRQYLRKTFDSISCFLMPYPGKQTARNSSFDGHWSAIEDDFVDMMKELFPILMAPENLTVKTINGVPVKAFELSVYIKQYVELFKSENLPEAKTIYESTLDNQFQILLSKAVEVYLQSVSLYEDHIKNITDIDQLHKVSKALALKYFDEEKKFGKQEDGLIYRKELEQKLKKALSDWKPIKLEFLEKINSQQAKTDVQKVLANNAKKHQEKATEQSHQADKYYVELQKQITQARYDTAESRREAEILKAKLDRAEKERIEALIKEKQARKQFEDIKIRLLDYEEQLLIQRETAYKQVVEKMNVVRKRDGVLQWFGNVGNGILNFFSLIGSAFQRLFASDRLTNGGWFH